MIQIEVVKLTEWLEKTQASDISIETSDNNEKWTHSRFMRTCTTYTGLQELINYRKQHNDLSIRLVSEDTETLLIHLANTPIKWC